ncbi:MAG: hypothetical protein ACJ8F7_04435, partial [Gemmataceae bacterium]
RDRPLRDIEARLARGETVTLIGETGGPRWSEWRLGGETGKAWVADDQSFRVESWSICLLDLVRGPGPARYRLRAEVWHRDSSHSGQVGFYVGHREDPSPAGAFHRFARFYFNEIIDDKAKHAELIDKFPNLPPAANGLNPPPQPTGNSVFLDYRLFRDGDWNTGWDQKIDGRSAELIAPVGYGGSWRPLTIDVSPERISARWGAGERVGELSSADLTANGRQSLLRMRKQRPGDHTFENLDLKFSASGSLGLYVNNSSASFRNVIVEPLAEDD